MLPIITGLIQYLYYNIMQKSLRGPKIYYSYK